MASPEKGKATRGSEGEGMCVSGQRATGELRAPGAGEQTELGQGKETMEQRHGEKSDHQFKVT